MKRTTLVLATLTVLLYAGIPARANTITYTEQTTASGSIGVQSFSSAMVTITMTADTSSVICFSGGCSVPVITAILDIAGTGSFAFTDPFVVLDRTGPNADVQFVDSSARTDVIVTVNPAFNTYGLTTAIGPVTGLAFVPNNGFGTTGGVLVWTSLGNSTFTASVVSTPEPGSLLLLGTGLAGLLGIRKKRALGWTTAL
jgi:hypothetical protein